MSSTSPSNAIGLSYSLDRRGQLNLPGITAASKKTVEELLLKDAETYHCFFRGSSLHNHLSHHLLAAYDLGASPGLLQKIYDVDSKMQRNILLKEEDSKLVINEQNWTQYLENLSAYKAYVQFYAAEIKKYGAPKTVQKYIFSEEANTAHMLVRLVGGALHPFIQVGYGAEFGNETLIATGLAQTSMHDALSPSTFAPAPPPSPNEQTPTLLELLRKVYDSPALHPPMPYDPDVLIWARFDKAVANEAGAALRQLVSTYSIPSPLAPADLRNVEEQIIHFATLLTFATGKEGRKPRLDFFLMHILTSALFLRPICENLLTGEEGARYAADLIRVYVTASMIVVLSRGRPRINPGLLMTYTDVPRPPASPSTLPAQPSATSIGAPSIDDLYSSWPELTLNVQYHPDPHVLKTMRSLIYGAQQYGAVPAGSIVGALVSGTGKQETHPSITKVDGTLFVRSAGMMMDTLGWVAQGQKEGGWDRSALGWEAAWEDGK